MKILLTGKPGIGKTTVIKKISEKLKDKATGFYTEEFRDSKGQREGFKIFTLDGKSGILASKKINSKYRVGSYGVNKEEFENLVIPLLENAINSDKIIIIDEIGKMELFSKKFVDIVKKIFENKNKTVVATIPVKNVHSIINWIKSLPDTILIEVTYSNRDELPDNIIKILEKKK